MKTTKEKIKQWLGLNLMSIIQQEQQKELSYIQQTKIKFKVYSPLIGLDMSYPNRFAKAGLVSEYIEIDEFKEHERV